MSIQDGREKFKMAATKFSFFFYFFAAWLLKRRGLKEQTNFIWIESPKPLEKIWSIEQFLEWVTALWNMYKWSKIRGSALLSEGLLVRRAIIPKRQYFGWSKADPSENWHTILKKYFQFHFFFENLKFIIQHKIFKKFRFFLNFIFFKIIYFNFFFLNRKIKKSFFFKISKLFF